MQKRYFLTVSLNPCLDINCYADDFKIDDVIRIRRKKISAGGKAFNIARFLAACKANVQAAGIFAGYNGRRFTELLKTSRISNTLLLELPGETRENYNFFLGMEG